MLQGACSSGLVLAARALPFLVLRFSAAPRAGRRGRRPFPGRPRHDSCASPARRANRFRSRSPHTWSRREDWRDRSQRSSASWWMEITYGADSRKPPCATLFTHRSGTICRCSSLPWDPGASTGGNLGRDPGGNLFGGHSRRRFSRCGAKIAALAAEGARLRHHPVVRCDSPFPHHPGSLRPIFYAGSSGTEDINPDRSGSRSPAAG